MTESATTAVRRFALTMTAAALIFCGGTAQAQNSGRLRIVTRDEGELYGISKDPAHMNWIPFVSVVAADLDGDAAADSSGNKTTQDDWTTGATSKSSSRGGGGAVKASASNTPIASKGVTSPRDATSGMVSGKRQHNPLVITREMDQSSPKLQELMAHHTLISEMEVDLGRPSKESKTGRYKLTDVLISVIQRNDDKASDARTVKAMETVTFNYQKIEATP